MPSHTPPVPPEQRSDKRPDDGRSGDVAAKQKSPDTEADKANRNDTVTQNTTNKGYQQDR